MATKDKSAIGGTISRPGIQATSLPLILTPTGLFHALSNDGEMSLQARAALQFHMLEPHVPKMPAMPISLFGQLPVGKDR